MIDIPENHLSAIRNILHDYVPHCEVRVFGSRITTNAKEYSDLDIAIVGKKPIDYSIIAEIKEAFQKSDLPFRVDVLDWNTISPEFRTVIEKKGFEIIT